MVKVREYRRRGKSSGMFEVMLDSAAAPRPALEALEAGVEALTAAPATAKKNG